jgi:membrane fusion protein (multidrug efflux system)
MSSFCYLGIPLLIVLMAGCSGNNQSSDNRSERAVSVKGQVVHLASKELTKSFTGTLEGVRQAVITAKIAEAVEKVMVSEGDRVEADQVLIQLDRTGPTSNFIQAQSLYLNAEKNYKKMKYLYDEGAVSESQFDAAKTEYEVSKANLLLR